MRTLAPARDTAKTARPLPIDLALAVLVGLAAALAKRYLDFHLGVPGHAGVGWIATLVAGTLVNPRRGMTVAAGLSMAVWGVPVGLGHTLGYNAALYGTAAGVLEASVLLRLPLGRWWGAMTAGAAVHIAKYAFVFGRAWVSGIIRNFEVYGILAALRNHLVFGLAGGLAGWALYRGGTALVDLRRRRA
jgi:hypothetical protein